MILSSTGSLISTREVKFKEDQFPGVSRAELESNSEIDPFLIKLNEESEGENNQGIENQVSESVLNPQDIVADFPENHPSLNNQVRAPQEISSRISTENILNYDRRGNIININLAESYFVEPKYYHQAINSSESKHWNEAIKKEIENMKNHEVWEVVEKT